MEKDQKKTDFGKEIGAFLRQKLKKAGMTQRSLAKNLKLASPTSVNKWILGKKPVPLAHVENIAAVLELTGQEKIRFEMLVKESRLKSKDLSIDLVTKKLKEDSLSIGEFLDLAMKRAGMTQTALAKRLGLANSAPVNLWISESNPVPFKHVENIVAVLKLTGQEKIRFEMLVKKSRSKTSAPTSAQIHHNVMWQNAGR